jgi:hypothetical protein
MYLYSTQLADHGKKHLEKKNMSFSKDGMKVRVKEINAEDYEDKTQRFAPRRPPFCQLQMTELMHRTVILPRHGT